MFIASLMEFENQCVLRFKHSLKNYILKKMKNCDDIMLLQQHIGFSLVVLSSDIFFFFCKSTATCDIMS